MKEKETVLQKPGYYSFKRCDDIAILRLGEKLLLETTDLSVSKRLLDVLDDVSQNEKIKVLVIINCSEKSGCKNYIDFCRRAIADEFDRKSIHIMSNVFDQIILKIADLKKLAVHADSGEIISLSLSVGLACDYRIVTDDTIYKKTYFDLGLLPNGGGVFFLCKMLGCNTARKILMAREDIDSKMALELGIVDKVVPHNELEQTAIQVAQQFAERPIRSLSGIKRLINYSMKDLKNYLSFESQELFKAIG